MRELTKPLQKKFTLKHEGTAALDFRAEWDEQGEKNLKPPRYPESVVPGNSVNVTAEWAENYKTSGTARLKITLFEADVSKDDPWKRTDKVETIPMRWEEQEPARWELLTPTILFSADQTNATLCVRNGGAESAPPPLPQVEPPFQLAPGYSVPASLAPGKSLTFPLLCGALPPGEIGTIERRIRIPPPQGSSQTELTAQLRRERRAPTLQPDLLVAVDFGTANTTVATRLGTAYGEASQEAKPLPGPGGMTRFPSAMLWTGQEWLFGQNALDEAEKLSAFLHSPNQNGPAMLLYEETSLKVNLSRTDEPFQIGPGAGRPGFSLEGLLRTYFTYLRKTLIEPHLLSESMKGKHIQYILTLPLLDGETGEYYQRQRDRTVRCFAQAMNIPPSDILIVPEPFAAALFYLAGPGQTLINEALDADKSTFRCGQRVYVFDSGGGTTDLICAEIEDAWLPPRLRQIAGVGLISEGKSANTFGGIDVSKLLHKHLNKIERDIYFHVPCQYIKSEPESRANREGQECQGKAASLIESYKFSLSLPMPSGTSEDVDLFYRDGDKVKEFVEPKIASLAEQLAEKMPSTAEPGEGAIALLVGGNTALPQIAQACQKAFTAPPFLAKVLFDDNIGQRMEAVALGATYTVEVSTANLSSRRLTISLQPHGGEPQKPWFDIPPRRLLPSLNDTRNLDGTYTMEIRAGDAQSEDNDVPYILFRQNFDGGKLMLEQHESVLRINYGSHDSEPACLWEGSL